MAFQALHGAIHIPSWPKGSFQIGNSAFSQNGSTDFYAMVVRIPKTGTLSKVHFRMANAITGDTYRVSFQDVDSAGHPDGTADEYRTLVVSSGDDNKILTTGILSNTGADGGTKRSVTAGDVIAVVLDWDSYVSGSLQPSRLTATEWLGPATCMQSTNSGSTWVPLEGAPLLALEYDDGSFAFLEGCSLFGTQLATTLGSGSSPDEYAMRFKLPWPVRTTGAIFMAATTLCDLTLFTDAGTTVAGPATNDVDSNVDDVARAWYWSSAVDLAADTWYRLSWKPTTATTKQVVVHDLTVANQMQTLPLGSNMMMSTRTDGGSWTNVTTKFIPFSLIVTALDDGAGGGGGGRGAGPFHMGGALNSGQQRIF
jgi:hypothetical protein